MPLIVVLEDDGWRTAAMRAAASTLLSDAEIQFFDNARQMEDWLATNGKEAALISLDCDLDQSDLAGEDAGSGEDITALLAESFPMVPVVIHSSNALRAPAMHLDLTSRGCRRVLLRPFQDANQWASDVRGALVESPQS